MIAANYYRAVDPHYIGTVWALCALIVLVCVISFAVMQSKNREIRRLEALVRKQRNEIIELQSETEYRYEAR